MAECDGHIVCPWDLYDRLQIHEDVDNLVRVDSKELCDSRCREWRHEQSDGRDNVEEMGEMLGAR